MSMRLVTILGLVLLAGCVKPDAATPEPIVTLAAVEPTTGTLIVHALMPDLQPLAGVQVRVADVNATTDQDGIARLHDLPAGTHDLEARKEAHRTSIQTVTVRANATTDVDVILAPAANDQHAHERGLLAHADVYEFTGHFDCSATYVIITGDCVVVLENVTGQRVDGTSERHVIDFPLDASWSTLRLDMTWNATLPTPATGEGMTLALEPAESPTDGHAARYAHAAGGSPLTLQLQNGVRHETATAEDMPNPSGGEVLRARAYVMGAGHDAANAGFLGVGATAKHAFTLRVTITYEGQATTPDAPASTPAHG